MDLVFFLIAAVATSATQTPSDRTAEVTVKCSVNLPVGDLVMYFDFYLDDTRAPVLWC